MKEYKWIRVSKEVHSLLNEVKKECHCNGFDSLFKLIIPIIKDFSKDYAINFLGDKTNEQRKSK